MNFFGQMLTSPDVALRRLLRLSPGPARTDSEGLFIGGFVAAEPEALTLTKSHNRIQVISPAAARTILLPTAGIRVGEVFRIINRSSYEVTVQASDASAVDIIALGYISVVALQDNPVSNAHWYVEDVYEEVVFTSVIADYATPDPTHIFYITRHGNAVIIRTADMATKTKVGTATPYSSTALPARLRPTLTQYHPYKHRMGAYSVGFWIFLNTGYMQWLPGNVGAWTAAVNTDLAKLTASYNLG